MLAVKICVPSSTILAPKKVKQIEAVINAEEGRNSYIIIITVSDVNRLQHWCWVYSANADISLS